MANLDADPLNADWTKGGGFEGRLEGVETLDDLMRFIDSQGLTLAQFKRLPVYTENVESSPLLQKL